MNQKKFDDFEKALTDLSSGQDFRKIVESYPDLEEEIETAKLARSFSATMVSSDILQRSRTKLLMHTKELRQEALPRIGFFQRIPRIAYVLVLAIFFLLSWNGLIVASAQALPGDHLYPAKITLEKLHIGLALNPQTHQKAEEEYQSRRVDEVKSLLAIGRMEFVQFLGIVEQQWNDHWTVDGIEVRLLPDTIILGDIQDGMKVEVEGSTLPEGWVQASEIHLQNFSFSGTVELISESNWTISGREVQITSSTLIDADIKVGDNVLIDVISDDFGNLTARSITRNAPNIQLTKTPILPSGIQEKSVDTPKTEDVSDDDQAGDDDSNEESKTPEPDEIEDDEENRDPDEKDESKDADESDEANESDENDESKGEDDSDDEDESHNRDERDEDVEPEEKD